MAEFRCGFCKAAMTMIYSGQATGGQGQLQCNNCQGWTPFKIEGNISIPIEPRLSVRVCPSCKTKASFQRLWDWPLSSTPDVEIVSALDLCTSCHFVMYYQGDRAGTKAVDTYPKNLQTPPGELLEPVKKAFAEALVCHVAGAPNGALLMCRRAIQEALDDLGAKKGNLPTQLDDLVSMHKLTPDLKEWADHARIGGRLAAHGMEGGEWGDLSKVYGDKEDAEAVIEFCNGFFEYVYVLPKRNEERRTRTKTLPA